MSATPPPDDKSLAHREHATSPRPPETPSVQPPDPEATLPFVPSENEPCQAIPNPATEPESSGHPEYIGDYRIAGVLARSGASVVYSGWDPRLQRTVALKLLTKVSPADQASLSEGRFAARLQHPGIVQVFHVLRHNDQVCLVLEYMEGGTLTDWLAQGSLPDFRTVASVLIALAEAVRFAHQAGVLHLDLKPGNVLVTATGEPKIADFGLAQARAGQLVDSPLQGTPRYMAPEQTHWGGEVGTWTDIYGLGAILYYMLTGQPPVSGSNLSEIFARVRQGDVVPIQQLRPDTPIALVAICQKCMRRLPAERYSSAADLKEDLQRFLAGQPLITPVAERAYRLRLWFEHPSRIRDAGLVLVTTSACFSLWCLLGLLLLATRVLDAPRRAELAWHITLWLTCGYLPALMFGLFTLLHRLWALWLGSLWTCLGVMLMGGHLAGWVDPKYDMGGLAADPQVLLVGDLLITGLFATCLLLYLPALRAWYALYRRKRSRSLGSC